MTENDLFDLAQTLEQIKLLIDEERARVHEAELAAARWGAEKDGFVREPVSCSVEGSTWGPGGVEDQAQRALAL